MSHNLRSSFKLIFRQSILLVLGLTLISSCIITRTPGFYSGYKRLTSDEKRKIIIVKNMDVLPALSDSITYAITAKHLEKILRKSTKAIVYFWSPNCSSNVCIPLFAFQNFCKENGYEAIVVAEYFDYEQLSIQGVNPNKVFAINHWHYGRDYCNTYVRKFKESLFDLFDAQFNKKAFSQYLYYNEQTLSTNKPTHLTKYPWR